MLFFPIGHRSSFVHAFPWVGACFIAACGFGFLFTYGEIDEAETELARAATEITEFVNERPYLNVTRAADVESRSDRLYSRAGVPLKSNVLVSASEAADAQRQVDAMVTAFDVTEREHPYMQHGFRASEPSFQTAITGLFVHGGWLHLLGNLWMFFILGLVLEDAYGRVLFSLFLAATAAAALTLHLQLHDAINVPLVGTSPVISGVMAAFLVRFGGTHIECAYWLPLTRVGVVMAPAWVLLPVWVGIEFLQTLVVPHQASVGTIANVGGFLAGFVLANIIKVAGMERGGRATEMVESSTGVHSRLIDEARDLMREGEYMRVIHRLKEVEREHGQRPDANTLLWRAHVQAGQASAGLRYGVRLIQSPLEAGDLVTARFAWRDLKASVGHGGPLGLRVRLAEACLSFDPQFTAEVALGLPEDPTAGDLSPRAQALLDRLPDGVVEEVIAGREQRGVLLMEGALDMAASQGTPPDSGLLSDTGETAGASVVYPAHESAVDVDAGDAPALGLASITGPTPDAPSSASQVQGTAASADLQADAADASLAYAPTEAISVSLADTTEPRESKGAPEQAPRAVSPAPGVIPSHPGGTPRLGDRWGTDEPGDLGSDSDGG